MAEMMTLPQAEAKRYRLAEQLRAIRAYIKVLKSQQGAVPAPDTPAQTA